MCMHIYTGNSSITTTRLGPQFLFSVIGSQDNKEDFLASTKIENLRISRFCVNSQKNINAIVKCLIVQYMVEKYFSPMKLFIPPQKKTLSLNLYISNCWATFSHYNRLAYF